MDKEETGERGAPAPRAVASSGALESAALLVASSPGGRFYT